MLVLLNFIEIAKNTHFTKKKKLIVSCVQPRQKQKNELYLEKVSDKMMPPVLVQDREHINVNLKEHYLTVGLYEEHIRYFAIFHLYFVYLDIFKIWGKFQSPFLPLLLWLISRLILFKHIYNLIYCSTLCLDLIFFHFRCGFNFLTK